MKNINAHVFTLLSAEGNGAGGSPPLAVLSLSIASYGRRPNRAVSEGRRYAGPRAPPIADVSVVWRERRRGRPVYGGDRFTGAQFLVRRGRRIHRPVEFFPEPALSDSGAPGRKRADPRPPPPPPVSSPEGLGSEGTRGAGRGAHRRSPRAVASERSVLSGRL